MSQGYFDYHRDAFGPICENQEQLLIELTVLLERGCQIDAVYQERQRQFFPVYDQKNCERTYMAIKEVCNETSNHTFRFH